MQIDACFPIWSNTMSKERNSRKETAKKPALTLKEKRAAKKAKKDTSSSFIATDK